MDGEPLPIIKKSDGVFIYNEEYGNKIFLDPLLVNCKIAILSVAGSERGGKSFLLNYILRYLASDEEKETLGEPGEELRGFDYRPGDEPTTHGIYIWSKSFLKTNRNGEKVAVFLMDTQGIYGENLQDDGHIFSLSVLTSSLMIYNVQGNLLRNVLEPLDLMLRHAYQFFTDNQEKKFENMVVLVRDWSLSNNFGYQAGCNYLSSKLRTSPNKLKDTYEFINSCFKHPVSCCLMPHPGERVTDSDFRGSLSELAPSFVASLWELIPSLINTILDTEHFTGDFINQYLNKCLASVNEGQPLISATEAYIDYELSALSREIQTDANKKLRKIEEEVTSNENERGFKLSREFTNRRETLERQAVKEFEARSENKGPIHERKLDEIKAEIKSSFNNIEANFLCVLCTNSVISLKENFGGQLENYINKGIMGSTFTREEKVKEKNEKLKDIVNQELNLLPKLQEIFSNVPLIDFDDDLNKSLVKLQQNRRQFIIGSIVFVIGVVAGGVTTGAIVASTAGAGAAATTAVARPVGEKVAASIAQEAVAQTAKGTVKGAVIGGTKAVTSTGAGTIGAALTGVLETISLFIKKSFSKAESSSCEKTSSKTQNKSEENFLDSLKETLLLLDRYLAIGGKISWLINNSKNKKRN